jgi:hypothetical protein
MDINLGISRQFNSRHFVALQRRGPGHAVGRFTRRNTGLSAKLIASLAVFWTMVQQIGSVMAGGYVAGRTHQMAREWA